MSSFIVFRLNVVVYCDDAFYTKFNHEWYGNTAETRIYAIMALVAEQYLESSFQTKLYVNTVAVKYAKGYNWMNQNWQQNYPNRYLNIKIHILHKNKKVTILFVKPMQHP